MSGRIRSTASPACRRTRELQLPARFARYGITWPVSQSGCVFALCAPVARTKSLVGALYAVAASTIDGSAFTVRA